MTSFSDIHQRAIERKGGEKTLASLLPSVMSAKKLAQVGDDRFLAMMAKAINQAGFNWTVIENKWPQFEEAFFGFDPEKLSLLPEERWEAYTSDTRVVRNWQKIKAVMDNVGFVLDESARHGSFGKFMANWPADDQIGLMAHLKKHGSRLGGQTAQWFMRYVGKDCFVISNDLVNAIQQAGVDIRDNPTSKRDLGLIQQTMNAWHLESGLPYTHLSKIAAYSCGQNYEADGIRQQMDKFSAGHPE